jgi:TetR/AcrR family transcriptional regulator, cholesterol catabolism regulator
MRRDHSKALVTCQTIVQNSSIAVGYSADDDAVNDAQPRNDAREDADLDAAVTAFALAHPQMGQAKAAAALRARGIAVSASGVRYLWAKHGLETTFKRLKAIEDAGRGAAVLTDSQRDIVRRGEAGQRFARRSKSNADDAGGDAAIARRELILEAAAQLFVERGYGGTSMREIAAKVGLLAGSVYHYYPAKENLFLAVQKEGFRQIMERAERAIAGTADPWDRLEIACANHVHSVVAGDAISRVTATGLFAIHEEGLQRRLKRDRDRYEAVFRKLIDALPLARGVDRSLFRLALFGALNWTLLWYRPGRQTPAGIARGIVSLLRGSHVASARPVSARSKRGAGTRRRSPT